MIKEISNFIESLDPTFKSLGIKPKEGLHVMFSIQNNDGELVISMNSHASTKKKESTPAEIKLLKEAASLTQAAWCVNTNKCFDLPTKAIHSCSPYCVAIKKENLTGGEKYNNNSKSQVYERINSYFDKALELVEDETDKQRIILFKNAINSEDCFNSWIKDLAEFKELKDAEYVIYYLDEPIEKFTKTNEKYLADKLFNTNDYNKELNGITFGTSDFFNGFPTKKPFLTHQSASFDIANRISSEDAKNLYELQDILSRNVLPKPLPIFIYQEELQEEIRIIKKGVEDGEKFGYREIIEKIHEKHQADIGNYYLLYYDRGEIKDFDFVAKFEYTLKDQSGSKWEILDLFDGANAQKIKNVFHFQLAVLQPIFNNSLITKTKNDTYQYKYFDDIESKFCKSDATYIQVLKFRRAFYDFIYKSKRQAITSTMFDEIMQTSILEDIRLDEIKNNFHTEERSIRQKLNIWFSLTNNFINAKNNQVMSSKLQTHREFIKQLADGRTDITTDEQYAFTVGQVIYYLLSKSKTADRSYKRLEPFMQQVQSKELNKSIARLFDSYKHENFSGNFRAPFAQILSYETKANVRDLIPTILSGVFSDNALFSNAEKPEEIFNEENEN
jgi:CRISPR-associated protein Csh1